MAQGARGPGDPCQALFGLAGGEVLPATARWIDIELSKISVALNRFHKYYGVARGPRVLAESSASVLVLRFAPLVTTL